MNIWICGGGNIAHALSVMIQHNITVLTRLPDKWSDCIVANSMYSNQINSTHSNRIKVTDSALGIDQAQIIIIAVPIYAFDSILAKISPCFNPKSLIVVICGRLFMNKWTNYNLTNNLVITARTPYICRIEKYGFSVSITGTVHQSLKCWFSDKSDKNIIEDLFGFKVGILDHIELIDLNNSNSILHPARLYDIISNKRLDTYFYADWTLESSTVLIMSDSELGSLIRKIGLEIQPSILDHYGATTAQELTTKMRSLSALKDIGVPDDRSHRYYTEDVDIALKYIIELGELYDVDMPMLKKIYNLLGLPANGT
jgi:opine dehydrogenase